MASQLLRRSTRKNRWPATALLAQLFASVGSALIYGLMISGAYYLAVTYATSLPMPPSLSVT